MNKTKKTIIFILTFSIILSSFIFGSTAQTENANSNALKTDNIHDNTYGRWANVVKSYLYEENGSLVRAEYSDATKKIVLEKYNNNFELISSSSLAAELDLFGGFYCGSEYNYAVWGKTNREESNSAEVIRIVKYAKSGGRIAAASVYGSNTTVPFDAGSVRFAEFGNKLYVYTAHEMYTTSDGLNHQSNMMMIVNTDSMSITHKKYEVSNVGTGYVSHSFNQFITVDEETKNVITLDHGDAHPRSVVLLKYTGQAGNDILSNPEKTELLQITGVQGNNTTGVNVGGITVSENNYLAVFNSIDQSKGLSEKVRNAYVSVTSKTGAGSKVIQLSSYGASGNLSAGNPVITNIGNDRFLIMWEETDINAGTYTDTVRSVITDGDGNIVKSVFGSTAMLSDCSPVVIGDKVVWYTTNNSAPTFFTADIKSDCKIKMENCGHTFTETVISNTTCTHDGKIKYTCKFCGYEYTETKKATGHNDYDSNGYCNLCGAPIPTENGDAYVTWEKTVYEPGESTATLTINCASGVSLQNITSNASFYFRMSGNTLYLNISDLDEGIYDLYLTLSDGQVIETSFAIGMEPETETTTEKETTTLPEVTTAEPETTTLPEVPTTEKETLTEEIISDPMPETTTENQPDVPDETTSKEEPTTERLEYTKGDLDNNGKITASDARMALRISAKLVSGTPEQLLAADVDGNGKVTASDARLILRYSAKLITSF